uniref:Uncharacterized protein n=1 Tax=Arion vulgaris TaxID=1028688 RepID=A0A0B7A5R0_9EUPU
MVPVNGVAKSYWRTEVTASASILENVSDKLQLYALIGMERDKREMEDIRELLNNIHKHRRIQIILFIING